MPRSSLTQLWFWNKIIRLQRSSISHLATVKVLDSCDLKDTKNNDSIVHFRFQNWTNTFHTLGEGKAEVGGSIITADLFLLTGYWLGLGGFGIEKNRVRYGQVFKVE